MGDWNPFSGDFWNLTSRDAGLTSIVLGGTGAIISPFYALGAGINELTGGESPTYNVWAAPYVNPAEVEYSTFTQAASGYRGVNPNAGEWMLPVLNPALPRLAGEVGRSILEEALGGDWWKFALAAAGAYFLSKREA